jgi:hypothetical protein
MKLKSRDDRERCEPGNLIEEAADGRLDQRLGVRR